MNPQWATALIAGAGLAGNALWTAVNLRIENRLMKSIAELQDWCDERYVRRPDSAVSQRISAVSPRKSRFSKPAEFGF